MLRKVQTLKMEKQNQLLVSTSILQSRQKYLEQVRIDVITEEASKNKVEDKKKNVSKELSQTIQAIRYIIIIMYYLLCIIYYVLFIM